MTIITGPAQVSAAATWTVFCAARDGRDDAGRFPLPVFASCSAAVQASQWALALLVARIASAPYPAADPVHPVVPFAEPARPPGMTDQAAAALSATLDPFVSMSWGNNALSGTRLIALPYDTAGMLWAAPRAGRGGVSDETGASLPATLPECSAKVQRAYYMLSLFFARALGAPWPELPPLVSVEQGDSCAALLDGFVKR